MHIVEENAIPKQTDPVPVDKLLKAYSICTAMESICRSHRGVGLAAAQINVPWQLFIVAQGGKFRYFANCEYEPVSEEKVDRIEGCLSLPNRIFGTKRWKEVIVTGQELILQEQEPTLRKFGETTTTIVFQHEIDHQNGTLVSDHGREEFFHPIRS